MKVKIASSIIMVIGMLGCLIIDHFALEETYRVEYDTIPAKNILSKTELIVYPLCYMKCHGNQQCKSVAFEMHNKDSTGDCYMLNTTNVPECFENDGNFNRPIFIGRKLTSECCGDVLTDDCEGGKNNPARSCYDLRMQNSLLKSGYYWVNFCAPTLVYCDMETAGGGWMMIGSAVVTSNDNPGEFIANKLKSSDITQLNEANSGKFLLSSIGLKKLRLYTKFSQIRIYCKKNYTNRTFHVITTKNEFGTAVVDYLTLQTDAYPKACDSYVKLDDDTSKLSSDCANWANGLWSSPYTSSDIRSYDHLMMLESEDTYISLIFSKNHGKIRLECDDNFFAAGYTPFGTWKYFVR